MWCSWARGQVNCDKGPRGLVCRPRWQSFLQLGGLKPPSKMCLRVRRECGMNTGPAQVMLLNGGGNSRCVACHLRSFAESDSMYLSHSSKPCAVGLSLPAPSFPSPLSSSFPPFLPCSLSPVALCLFSFLLLLPSFPSPSLPPFPFSSQS